VNAFAEHAPMAMRDATKEPQWGKITDVVTGQEMRAGLSVPVQLEGGPIGSLDLYCIEPRDWDQAEISAAQVLRPWPRPCSVRPLPPRSRGG
jgi:GAF domain-containing protein